MSVAFLARHRTAFRWKSLLGLCPFRLTIAETRRTIVAVCDRKTTAYTALYSLAFVISYVLLSPNVLYTGRFRLLSSTLYMCILFEHASMLVAIPLLLFCSWYNRARHTDLVNAIAALHDRVRTLHADRRPAAAAARSWPSRRSTINWLWLAYQVSGLMLMLVSVLDCPLSVAAKMYYVFFIVGIVTYLVFVMHVHDMVQALNDVHSAALAEMPAGGALDRDVLAILWETNRCAARLEPCFGVQLLLCNVRDFIFLSVVLFFMIVQYADKGNPFSPIDVYMWAISSMPTLVNSMFISQCFGRRQSQVDEMQRMLCRCHCETAAEVGQQRSCEDLGAL